ncbi:proteasome subunit alpha type-7-1-like [Leptidea sinapis]|uniref:proteasome subunit alpha type-7-1-like n=1 Tax=Leptidea sinapis TaxID=189913 RepID=UPI0021C2A166|nr:proteasome subunit alpha type-7-1-like [Leptidea sinapis]
MSRYDRAITVFSPDGQLLQVHYAQEAVRRGSAVVGIRGSNAIVLAVEKRVVPELQSDRTEKKIVLLDDHIVLAFAGVRADARVLISRAQIECQSYRLSVEDPVTTEYVARYLAGIMQQYTQSNGRRPFGVSCLIGGFDADGPHLFQTEPSGTYYEWMACSTGRCEKTTRDYLEKNFKPQLVTSEHGAILLAVASLLEVQYGGRGLEVAILKRSSPITKLSPEAIQSYITEVQKEKEDREKKT